MAGAAGAADAPRGVAAVVSPQGEPVAAKPIEDSEFGVRTSRFGLDRQVEMYQWQRDDRGGYRQVWKPALVDSSDYAADYANPTEIPLASRIWWASSVTLDGKPVALPVLKALGRWQEFRPAFTRLPANLAATFQPEGDGLGSAINPLDPRIGDLRIHWRALHLPPLIGKVELRDGTWQLPAPTRAASAPAQAQAQGQAQRAPPAAADLQPPAHRPRAGGKILLFLAVSLGVLLVRWLLVRPRRR
ncbi:MAG: hypothetical protein ABIO84_09735 [Lysobacter sp.]